MSKIALYVNTIKYLKIEQLWFQIWKRLGGKCSLIKGYRPVFKSDSINKLPANESLDFDSDFLSRFSVDELMHNKVSLLHSTEELDLNGSWFFNSRSSLWNHNLHYFEYMFALVKAYQDTRQKKYLEKIKELITSWIKQNHQGSKGSAWECYPIAIRIPNWIDLYAFLRTEFDEDEEFSQAFLKSLFDQYVFLFDHLEKHLLANHYFEDLKTLIIAAVFFGDEEVCKVATDKLLEQCKEQVFEDGMHYERSPMYQKILLEDLIRVETALEYDNKANECIRNYIRKMLDVSYSFEFGMDRLPLFNDCGKNVSKSLSSLILACDELNIHAETKEEFYDSRFYIFNFGDSNEWRLIVDAGQPGPEYSPGHSHCEMMSFELFQNGKPVLVNCGTYAYQCDQRLFFKSTKASNTVGVVSIEQSEIWSSFRMARRARLIKLDKTPQEITIVIRDYKKNNIKRHIKISNETITIDDESTGNELLAYLHFSRNDDTSRLRVICGKKEMRKMPYSEEFGKKSEIDTIEISGENILRYIIELG